MCLHVEARAKGPRPSTIGYVRVAGSIGYVQSERFAHASKPYRTKCVPYTVSSVECRSRVVSSCGERGGGRRARGQCLDSHSSGRAVASPVTRWALRPCA